MPNMLVYDAKFLPLHKIRRWQPTPNPSPGRGITDAVKI